MYIKVTALNIRQHCNSWNNVIMSRNIVIKTSKTYKVEKHKREKSQQPQLACLKVGVSGFNDMNLSVYVRKNLL